MKKVFIKYNPYKLETEVRVDGKMLAKNSKLKEKIAQGSRLQEWIEDMPKLLLDEYNDNNFDITFHGTLLDFEDLKEVFTEAYKKGQLKAKLEHKPAKEVSDKEALIDKIFEKIQSGPFDELKDEQIVNAFKNAKNSDFEVCVIATMSAGKSTLINSMLGAKLMPSKQEACTAIITKIKDNDKNSWHAEAYNKDKELAESHNYLNYKTMERLNSDQNIVEIKIEGNIPFVEADDMALVLIDTPGPNNRRNEGHKRVQSEFLNKSSKALILYIMQENFGTNDDDDLLERVAESMAVGGKQSKDRFIFVINKMDNRAKEDGETEETLNKICDYLKKYHIKNPNLFPAAALPALNIRLIKNREEVDEDIIDETEWKVRKLNRNENLHFENFASLPSSIKKDIKNELSKASEANDKALIHTGIPSIEAAIRQYVEKYAKTAKIKNIVDTFIHKLDEVRCFEATKRELASRQDESQRISQQISSIRKKIDDGEVAKTFKDAVNKALEETKDEITKVIEEIKSKVQDEILGKLDDLRGSEIELDNVNSEINAFKKFVEKLEKKFKNELDESIRSGLVNTGNLLLEGYKKKLSSMAEEIDVTDNLINIDPLKLMGGSVNLDVLSIENIIRCKEVEDRKEWVENTDKKWYKPWTWFEEEGYYRKIYKNKEYIDAEDLFQKIIQPLENSIIENTNYAKDYAVEQSEKISEEFNSKFEELDNVLKGKLDELKSIASDEEKAEKRVQESECKLKWLKEIKEEIESILEI